MFGSEAFGEFPFGAINPDNSNATFEPYAAVFNKPDLATIFLLDLDTSLVLSRATTDRFLVSDSVTTFQGKDPPILEGVNFATASNSDTAVLSTPTGTSSGDLLFVFISYNGGKTTTPPASWTPYLTRSLDAADNAKDFHGWVGYKLANSEGAATDLTFVVTSSTAFNGLIARVSKVSISDPLGTIESFFTQSVDPISTSRTPASNFSLILAGAGTNGNSISAIVDNVNSISAWVTSINSKQNSNIIDFGSIPGASTAVQSITWQISSEVGVARLAWEVVVNPR